MSHMPTIANAQWADVTLATYGVVGDGTTENSTAINAALTAMAGKGVFFPPGTYRFDKMLSIPANTHVELWPGAILQCRVTGGGHGIQFASASKIYSVGGGGNAAQIVAYNGCNIDSLITNTNQDGTQEYAYLSGLYITANSGATVSTALVNLVSVFVNSGVRDCVIICNGNAPTGLRIAGGSVSGFGPVFVEDTWVTTGTSHNVVITEANPTVGGGTCWINNLTSEHQASGSHGVYIKGYGGIANVSIRNFHYENGVTASSTTAAIYVDGCAGFMLDHADILSSPITNKKGIVITSDAHNQRSLVRNVQNPNLVNPILDDAYNSKTFAARQIGVYQSSDPGASSGSSDQMFTHLVQMPGGLATKTKAGAVSDGDFLATPPDGTIAVDTTNSKIYARIGGAWKSVTVA